MPAIEKFTGLNSKDEPWDARAGDLQVAENVLITDNGSIKRRPGKSLISSGSTHSLFSYGDTLYYVQGGDLVSYNISQSALVTPLQDAGAEMFYLPLNGHIYYSNGVDSGVITNGSVAEWGIAQPTAPTCADLAGSSPSGRYLVSITYMTTDGEESAASITTYVDVTSGGIALTGIPTSTDSRVDRICVYVSSTNGEAGPRGEGLFRSKIISNGTTSTTVTDMAATGPECYTLNMTPMPAGQYLGFYKGRIYVAVDNFLIYSNVYNYDLTDISHSFLPFDGDISSVCYLENGIWVGTEKGSMFVTGNDPQGDGGLLIKNRIPGKCLTGSVVIDRESLDSKLLGQGQIALFVNDTGVYAGDNMGQSENLTKKWSPSGTSKTSRGHYHPGNNEGYYIFDDNDGQYALNLNARAVTKMIEDCNSFATVDGVLYAAGAGGFWIMDADDDEGTNIPALIEKYDLHFNDSRTKRIVGINFHMRSDGDMTITVISSSGSGTATLTSGGEEMHGCKVKLPRGVVGRNIDIALANSNGSFFEIASADMDVEISRKRRERQQ